jgi:hypothetical protein
MDIRMGSTGLIFIVAEDDVDNYILRLIENRYHSGKQPEIKAISNDRDGKLFMSLDFGLENPDPIYVED